MFEPMINKEPTGIRKIYLDKYALWVQLLGCVLLFGSPFFFIAQWHHHIALVSGIVGMILCTINWGVDG